MLTSKQRAYLRSLATNLDTILHVGKGGVTETVIRQADDAILVRELIKGRILETSPTDVRTTAEMIAQETNSEVVQVIGSRFVLYRRNNDNPVIVLPKSKK